MADKPKIAKSTKVDGEKVVVVRGVKVDENEAEELRFERTFDFTGCTREQLMLLCCRPLTIDDQGDWRKLPANKRKAALKAERKVTEMLNGKRRALSQEEKFLREAQKMHESGKITREELKAMEQAVAGSNS